jgi:hypothetical protein
MTTRRGRRRYLRFVVVALAVTAALAALGWIPTQRRAGSEALPALLAGCAVSLVAALASALMLQRVDPGGRLRDGVASGPEAARAMTAGLQAMGVRLLVILALGSAVGLADIVPLEPFLIWMVISYLALLPVETHFALIDVGDGVRAGNND